MVNINTRASKTRYTPTLTELARYATATQYNLAKPLTWHHAQLVVNHYGCNDATLPEGWRRLREMVNDLERCND